MATRQYIGARYVPAFADPIEWDNQRSFEALTIVNYLGASYTSKKPVPAGTLPTNSDYWALTGNYNAQVEEYRRAVEQLDNSISPVYILLSDSYGLDNQGGVPGKSWTTYFKEIMGLTPGVNFFTSSEGGIGFAHSNAQGHNFKTLFTALSDSIPAKTLAGKNVVVIVGGGYNDNDQQTDPIQNNILAFVNAVKAKIPSASIKIGFMANTTNAATMTKLWLNVYPAFTTCGRFGAESIANLSAVISPGTMLKDDGIHPNEIGSNALAGAVVCSLGGTVEVFRRNSVTSTSDTWPNINIVFYKRNYELSAAIPTVVTSATIPQDPSQGWVRLGDFSTDFVPNATGPAFEGVARVNITRAAGEVVPLFGIIRIWHNSLHLFLPGYTKQNGDKISIFAVGKYLTDIREL